RLVAPVGGKDIRCTVAIDVPGNRHKHRAKRVPSAMGIEDEGGPRNAAGINVDTTMVCYTRTRRAHHEQSSTIAAGTGYGTTETVSSTLARERQQQRSVLAGVDIRVSRVGLVLRSARSPYDDILESITVNITGCGDMISENLVFSCRPECVQDLAVATGVDMRDTTLWSTGCNIRNPIPVGIADPFQAAAQLIARLTVGAPEQHSSSC